MTAPPRIALTTYSVKPRGGVVHTLELAEALHAAGVDVSVVAMGDPAVGFYREVAVPVHIIRAPEVADTLEQRVFSWIEAMTSGLSELAGDFDIFHSQDCISARAANRVRRAGGTFTMVRTVHHVDDFTTQALIDCQAAAITEPDHILVVSELWRRQLAEDFDVSPHVVANGVRTDRFTDVVLTAPERADLRARVGATDRHLFLTIGGIEPRKGSKYLVEAMGKLKADLAKSGTSKPPVLAVIGGHSFQDYREYREAVLGSLEELGLVPDVDMVLLGTVSDEDLPRWFRAADSFVFPSVKEGWGLVILEAQAAGLPVVASDIDVFHEFLVDGENALLTRTGDAASLAAGMARVMSDSALVEQLKANGVQTARHYSWDASAAQHAELYQRFAPADGA